MPRVLLIQPSSGSPEYQSFQAWKTLTATRVYAAPGDLLAAHARDNGIDVTDLDDGTPGGGAEPPGELRGRNLLSQHAHGSVSPLATARAEKLAALAEEHGEVAFIVDDDSIVRAVLMRALQSGLEVEVVIGPAPRGHTLLELVRVMQRLRGPGGCPWDAEQTHATLAKHLLDETYEVLDAIENGSPNDLAEELGDVLLQVVFHAEMAAGDRTFDIDDVSTTLIAKLIRRHPHVFGGVEVSGAAEVVSNWDQIKRGEKERGGALEDIPASLPALALAQKMQRRAGAAGFDWPDVSGALAKVREEADELARATTDDEREAELGDLLFSLVALGRHLGIDAESALRRSSRTFKARFEHVEEQARARNTSLSDLAADEILAMWEQAK